MKLLAHYLLDHDSASNRAVSIGIFVVRVNRASERHGIGKKVRFGYQFG